MAGSRAFASIQSLIESKEYYSAHQKARTTVARLLSKRSAAAAAAAPPSLEDDPKAQDACELLYKTARSLLENEQQGSGTDIATYLLETWKMYDVPCDKQHREQCIHLLALVGPKGSWRKTLGDNVLAWSAKTGSGPAGDRLVRQYLGEVLTKEKDYASAAMHLLLCATSDAARTLADAMFAWASIEQDQAAYGRYAGRAVLTYLEMSALKPARIFLSHFLSLVLRTHANLLVVRFPYPPPGSALATSLESSKGTATDSSVEGGDELLVTRLASLNFLQLALHTIACGAGEALPNTTQAGSGATANGSQVARQGSAAAAGGKNKGRQAWIALVQRYQGEVPWLQSAEVKECIQVLGEIYFGIAPPRNNNFMAEMLGSLLGGGGPPPGARR